MGQWGRRSDLEDHSTRPPPSLSENGMRPPPPRPNDDERNFELIQQQENQPSSPIGRMTEQATIGFQGYSVMTKEPFAGFHHIVIAYCLLAFVLMYPFVVCVRQVRQNRKRRMSAQLQAGGNKQQQVDGADLVSPPGSELLQSFGGGPPKQVDGREPKEISSNGAIHTSFVLPPQSTCSAPSPSPCDQESPTNQPIPVTPTTTKSTLQDSDKPLSDSFPAMPPSSIRTPVLLSAQQPSTRSSQQPQSRQPSQVASSSGILSRIPSAATTGRLHSAGRGSTAAWPRHRHSRRPSGDPSWQWRRAIQTERRHRSRRIEQILSQRGGGLPANPNSPSNSVLFRLKNSAAGMMSDLANSVLTAEHKEVPHPSTTNQQQQQQQRSSAKQVSPHQQPFSAAEAALYARKTMAMRHRPSQPRRPSYSGSARSGSIRSWNNERGYPSSVMSSIVDDITPNDAADADDPGKVRVFPHAAGVGGGAGNHLHANRPPVAAACCTAFEPWLDVAEPNEEWRRLMGLAFPVTLGAMVEPVARCILIGILSQWVGTHAMVAFLLVQLLHRMTGETLSVAITDAESTLVQMALTSTATNDNGSPTFTKEGYRLAGQYVQLSCLFQLVIVGAILLSWYIWMDDVILWWVDSEEIACLAQEYFQIILFLFLAQAMYRAVMVPCHMRGSEHSTIENVMDIAVTIVTLITIVVVLSKTADIPGEYPEDYLPQNDYNDVDTATGTYTPTERLEDSRTALITIGWIQVIIGIASCFLKVLFCVIKGWLDQFWGGLLRSVALLNFGAFCNLLLASIPLILGSLLEMGEVDLLTLFVQYLGPAEVAAWAMLGSLWDVLEASTEGISEAAAIRVAFHLSASHPAMAKKLAHKALFWTVVQGLIFTSILLLAGKHVIVSLTVDYTLQHLLDGLLGLMALANLSMAFAHVCWSLVGAQGRFNLATLVMLACRWMVTMPLALIFIFALQYDEETLAGAVAVGTATSACLLAAVLFSSNWNDVAQELFMQGLLSCDDDDDFDFSFGDDDDSEDDDDDDSFGVGGSGYPSMKKSLDNDDSGELPQSTEPTTRSGTNTGSGVNSGAGSGLISGGTTSGMSGS